MVSVIGPNGAGKSTAFKTIVGFLRPTSGRVIFDGQEITGLRPDQVLRLGLAYVPQGRIVFPQMTVLENLEMGAYIERDARRIREGLERVYALFPILGRAPAPAGRHDVGRRAADGGHRPRADDPPQAHAAGRAVARAVPAVRLDDLRPADRDEAGGVHADGRGAERGAGAGRVGPGYALELGQNRFEGTGPELLADPEVKRLYLGG